MMPGQDGELNQTVTELKEQLLQRRPSLQALSTAYYGFRLDELSQSGLIGRIVTRALWDLDNLVTWMGSPLQLVAYSTRSLLELTTILWSVERTGDWQRWYGLAARDASDCVERAMTLRPGHEDEGRKVINELFEAYGKAGVVVPAKTEVVSVEAKNGGYSSEYYVTFKVLSKFVHPTPLTLFAPPIAVTGNEVFRSYFLTKSLKYLHSIYCLAAEYAAYNPAGIDIATELALLRAELT
jgi:hypothetical protein